MPNQPLLRVSDVCKSYDSRQVLANVSLDVFAGEVVCIIGPSGSGKSTLLRCISMLEPIDNGEMSFLGKPVPTKAKLQPAVRQEMGMVFQSFNLFPHRTALENVVEGPRFVLRLPRAECVQRARELLALVGLNEHESKMPHQLSGGQQQRVAIARSLAMQPKLMLFDEATSALDPELVGEVLDVMRQLAKDGMTMVIVTHEMGFAQQVGDRLCMFDEGRIIEEAKPVSLLRSPREDRTIRFLSRVRTFDEANAIEPHVSEDGQAD